MVSNQLRTNAVTDAAVLAALESVPRDRFVPADRAALAYVDIPVPLGDGRSLNAPLITARLLQDAAIKPGQSVLLVGAATGYAAALLVALGAKVTALESSAALAENARTNLEGGATVVEGPLAAGHAAAAPYDAVIIDGAVDHIPAALWDQLRDGGTVMAALREGGVTRVVRGVRSGASHALFPVLDADAAPLPGFDTPKEFRF
jgi:protein-L-isoaspartate(D-aspartate) O-methyltransferase